MGMPKKPITEKIDEEEDKYSDDQNAFINEALFLINTNLPQGNVHFIIFFSELI
jgi:hypothetical protein